MPSSELNNRSSNTRLKFWKGMARLVGVPFIAAILVAAVVGALSDSHHAAVVTFLSVCFGGIAVGFGFTMRSLGAHVGILSYAGLLLMASAVVVNSTGAPGWLDPVLFVSGAFCAVSGVKRDSIFSDK